MSIIETISHLPEGRFRDLLTTLAVNRELIQNCGACREGVILEGKMLQARKDFFSCTDCPAHLEASLTDLREMREVLTALALGILPYGGGLARQSNAFIGKLALAGRILRELGYQFSRHGKTVDHPRLKGSAL